MKEQQIEKRISKLEMLSEEQQSGIIEMALRCSLADMAVALKKHGIDTSAPSLSRFIRKDRERRLLEDGKEMKETVDALAERGREGKLREGTLEAVRQRLYEQALCSQSPEEAQALYAALVKEEAKLKEIELEARKVAVAEQQVKLQQVKMEVLAGRATSGGRGRMKALVETSEAVVEVAAVSSKEERNEKGKLWRLLGEVSEIVNRGGSPEEKVTEVRARLGAGMKMLGAGGT